MIRIRHLLSFLCVAYASAAEPPAEKPKAADPPAVLLDGRPVHMSNGMLVRHPEGMELPPEDFDAALEGRVPLAVINPDGKIVAEVYGSWSRGKLVSGALRNARTAKEKADAVRADAEKNPLITMLRRTSAEKTRFARRLVRDISTVMFCPDKGEIRHAVIDSPEIFDEYGNVRAYKGKDEGEGVNELSQLGLESILIRNPDERHKEVHEITTVRMDTPNKLGKPWIKHAMHFDQFSYTYTFELVAAETDFKRALPLFERMLFAEEKKTPTPETRSTEQGGADQPATAPEAKPEGNEKTKPDPEGRSQ